MSGLAFQKKDSTVDDMISNVVMYNTSVVYTHS